jgi:formiminotetrahydrofolate cyclodeaminase
MARFAEQTISSFLEALASSSPTPGGGTAAAIAGAMGTALLMMVAGMTKSRTGSQEEAAALAEATASLISVRERFSQLADTDSEAYNQVLAAYKLPKSDDAEKAARKAAVQLALTAATTAPLETLRAADQAVQLAAVVAQHGNRNAVSDVGVGIGLLLAAADGAVANVRINVGTLADESFKSAAAAAVDEISRRIAATAALAKEALDA